MNKVAPRLVRTVRGAEDYGMKQEERSTTETVRAPDRGRFCDIVGEAAQHRLPGFWFGSSFRHHPRGIMRDGIILTNEWNIHDYCSAEVMLDPSSPLARRCQDPCLSGDASCRPERGGTLCVYSSGKWSSDDGPWRAAIVGILEGLELEIADARAHETAAKAEEKKRKLAEHEVVLAAARAALGQQ